MKTFKLNNGQEMPTIGLGTFKGEKEEIQKAVECAIDSGYRLIDTAYMYLNEEYVGAGINKKIKEGVVKREDLFVVTKLHATHVKTPELIKENLETSLKRLQLDYVDLWLIHTPLGMKPSADKNDIFPVNKETGEVQWDYTTNVVDTYKGMEPLVKAGLTRALGVSNFSIKQMERIQAVATVPLCAQQIECHPYFQRADHFEFCKKHNIALMCFGPIGAPYIAKKLGVKPVLEDEFVATLGQKYGKTATQIVLRFLVQSGRIAIPKSVTPSRIAENNKIFDFELTDEDMAGMTRLDKNENLFYRGEFAPGARKHPEWQL